jgi:hypothetical protein
MVVAVAHPLATGLSVVNEPQNIWDVCAAPTDTSWIAFLAPAGGMPHSSSSTFLSTECKTHCDKHPDFLIQITLKSRQVTKINEDNRIHVQQSHTHP